MHNIHNSTYGAGWNGSTWSGWWHDGRSNFFGSAFRCWRPQQTICGEPTVAALWLLLHTTQQQSVKGNRAAPDKALFASLQMTEENERQRRDARDLVRAAEEEQAQQSRRIAPQGPAGTRPSSVTKRSSLEVRPSYRLSMASSQHSHGGVFLHWCGDERNSLVLCVPAAVAWPGKLLRSWPLAAAADPDPFIVAS